MKGKKHFTILNRIVLETSAKLSRIIAAYGTSRGGGFRSVHLISSAQGRGLSYSKSREGGGKDDKNNRRYVRYEKENCSSERDVTTTL